jgi:putative tryptophan/tyrosine transport system substrate-binding protein
MRRREFITLLGGAAAAWPFAAHAQQKGKTPRIGVLWHAASAEAERIPLAAFREGLKDYGYVPGQTILVEDRFPAEEPERFRSYAAELADLKVDILVAITRPAALAAQRVTSTIPIIFVVIPDPIATKLVGNLARPEGNLTGLSNMALELTAKRVEVLKETIPDLMRAAILVNANDPEGARAFAQVGQAAAQSLGFALQPVEVRAPEEFEAAFASMSRNQVQGLVVAVDGLFYSEQKRLAALAIQHRLPLVVHAREMVESGALMSYGPNIPAIFRRAGYFVDRILKGARPADLPVEQPTKIELSVNNKTAKSLGLTISPTMLTRATEVFD